MSLSFLLKSDISALTDSLVCPNMSSSCLNAVEIFEESSFSGSNGSVVIAIKLSAIRQNEAENMLTSTVWTYVEHGAEPAGSGNAHERGWGGLETWSPSEAPEP